LESVSLFIPGFSLFTRLPANRQVMHIYRADFTGFVVIKLYNFGEYRLKAVFLYKKEKNK